jgi:hypothetical protein
MSLAYGISLRKMLRTARNKILRRNLRKALVTARLR